MTGILRSVDRCMGGTRRGSRITLICRICVAFITDTIHTKFQLPSSARSQVIVQKSKICKNVVCSFVWQLPFELVFTFHVKTTHTKFQLPS